MITIRLLDARRGLNLKCRELFRDEKIADAIYRCLCDGIEECEDAEPERKKGEWINEGRIIRCNRCKIGYATVKGMKSALTYNFCPNCGADMRQKENDNV